MSLTFSELIDNQIRNCFASNAEPHPVDPDGIMREIDSDWAEKRQKGARIGAEIVRRLAETGELPESPLLFSDVNYVDPTLSGFLQPFGQPLHKLSESEVIVGRCEVVIEEIMEGDPLPEQSDYSDIVLPGVRIHFLPLGTQARWDEDATSTDLV